MTPEIVWYRERVEAAGAFLRSRLPEPPEIVISLGTGLGGVLGQIAGAVVLPWSEIPHFCPATSPSHVGSLVLGELAGRRVAVLQGRLHYYEGYSLREVTFPLRVLSRLGASTLLLANAAGGLNPLFRPGCLALIRDHLNFIPDNPLRGINGVEWGERFPDLSRAYDHQLIELALEEARRLGLAGMHTGVYAAVPGPSLETPAETRFLRRSGADLVGMSTVPEVIVARQAGMRVLACSVVANYNDPDDFRPILLEEVLAQVAGAEADLKRLLLAVLMRMA
ncbi:MAG: purine-nucleoside phosphorylase [Desulfobulbaceae bacterium]|nr:purine-nucleoside phosphorylase [Desulfobulbaceae bacterium]